MKNAIHWFEIPAIDIDRAAKFWEATLGVTLKRESFLSIPHAIFGTDDDDGVRGAIIESKDLAPSTSGSRIYLGTTDIDGVLARVPEAGGAVVLGKTDIGPAGVFALVKDTEGNVVGVHTRA